MRRWTRVFEYNERVTGWVVDCGDPLDFEVEILPFVSRDTPPFITREKDFLRDEGKDVRIFPSFEFETIFSSTSVVRRCSLPERFSQSNKD
jgi:hypothetical protein